MGKNKIWPGQNFGRLILKLFNQQLTILTAIPAFARRAHIQ